MDNKEDHVMNISEVVAMDILREIGNVEEKLQKLQSGELVGQLPQEVIAKIEGHLKESLDAMRINLSLIEWLGALPPEEQEEAYKDYLQNGPPSHIPEQLTPSGDAFVDGPETIQ